MRCEPEQVSLSRYAQSNCVAHREQAFAAIVAFRQQQGSSEVRPLRLLAPLTMAYMSPTAIVSRLYSASRTTIPAYHADLLRACRAL